MTNLFVYGTLKIETIEEVMPQLLSYLHFAGNGFVRGRLFDIIEYPGAICDDNTNNQVFGQLFTIRLGFENEVLHSLDDYEGYNERDIAGSLFRRDKVLVYNKEANAISAWIYWYNQPVAGLKEIAGGIYGKK